MRKKINIGLIGCGIVGVKRVNNLPQVFNLIACADPLVFSNKFFSNKKDCFLTKNWRKLIDLNNLDAVLIATTHYLHSKILDECVNKGIHVFIEKPAGISALNTKKIIVKLKKKKNLIVRVGFNHRFHPAFLKAKKIINNNKIGKLTHLRAIYGHGGRINYNKEWRFNKKLSGGGELIDKGSHLIDLSRFFLGDLKINSYELKTFFWNMKLEDNCFLNLENSKGNIAFLHASCTEWKNKFIFEIFGRYGKIEINGLGRSYGPQTLIYYKMLKKMGVPKTKIFKFSDNENFSWKYELKEFYQDIIKKRQPSPSIFDAYKNLEIINTIYKNKK